MHGAGALSILRENYHCVWPDADFARAGESIGSFLMGFDVRCGMIVKVRAVVVGVTVKARFPQSGPRKTDDDTHRGFDSSYSPPQRRYRLGPVCPSDGRRGAWPHR